MTEGNQCAPAKPESENCSRGNVKPYQHMPTSGKQTSNLVKRDLPKEGDQFLSDVFVKKEGKWEY